MNQTNPKIMINNGLKFVYDKPTLEKLHLETNFYQEKFPKIQTKNYFFISLILNLTIFSLLVYLLSHFPHTSTVTAYLIFLSIEIFFGTFSSILIISSINKETELKIFKLLFDFFKFFRNKLCNK